MRGKHLFEIKKKQNKTIANLEALIQAETRIVFPLGGKGKEYFWEREGEQLC